MILKSITRPVLLKTHNSIITLVAKLELFTVRFGLKFEYLTSTLNNESDRWSGLPMKGKTHQT